MITCLGVTIQKYQNNKLIGVIGGHFIDTVGIGKMFDQKNDKLTEEGKTFLLKIKNLMEENDWENSNSLEFKVYYNPRLDGKIDPITEPAYNAIVNYFSDLYPNMNISYELIEKGAKVTIPVLH